MSNFSLEINERTVTGKKVKQLRQEEQIPGVLYGPDNEPVKIQSDMRSLLSVLQGAGGTQLIDLQLGKETIPALAREVQRDIVRGDLLHVDFYRVAMDRLTRTVVPIILHGEPEAVKTGLGDLIHYLLTIEVEALPADLPPHIDLDIASLVEIGDQILVSELLLPDGVTVIAVADDVVVKLDYKIIIAEEEEEEEEDLFGAPAAGDVEVITERSDDEDEE